MTPEQALAEARASKLRPVYLIAGEEQYQQSKVVRALRQAALIGGTPGLNEELLVAGEVPVDAVLSACRTLPMLAKTRLVVVRSLERWEPRGKGQHAEALDQLAAYAKDPAPSTRLLLVAGKLDARRKLVTTAKSGGFLVSCERLAPRALPAWVSSAAREQGNTLAPGMAELIAELAGPELSPVADAVDRVCLYAGAGVEVTEEAVAECIVRLRPATVWELVGAVGRRDVGAALSALDSVYDSQDRGLRLVGTLAWSTRQLLKFESATRAGLPPPEAAQRAGAPPFKARELAEQVKRVPKRDLELWLETLAEVDLALKGGSRRPPKAILEHAILAMCQARGGAQKNPARRPARRSGA